MDTRDRRRSLILFALAAGAWAVVAAIALLVDPLASANSGFAGAGALGAAAALTSAPLFWLVGFSRQHRIAYRGDWIRALRRGAWVGALMAIFVVMRLNGIFQPQIGLFLIALAVVAEVTLSACGANRA